MIWTGHGGRLAEARAAFGEAGEPWLDLSTGINPHPWPGVEALAIGWTRLPEESALLALETAAANYFGVDRDYVAAVPGTEIGLRLLGTLLPGPAHHVAPTYRTHAEMIPGSVAVGDVSGVSEGALIVANPNNPDGRILSVDDLLTTHDRLHARGGWLVVDEAFADAGVIDPFSPSPAKAGVQLRSVRKPPPRSVTTTCEAGPRPSPGKGERGNISISIVAHVADDARLIVFRSFGKFFGLAGLRLGFVIAPRAVIARLRGLLGAWPVSAGAIAIGTAAYRDAGWIVAMREQLARDAAALDAMLRGCGLAPIGACPLFRLLDVPNAGVMFTHLARHAILTRPFDHDPRWLRIGLPGSAERLARLERGLLHG